MSKKKNKKILDAVMMVFSVLLMVAKSAGAADSWPGPDD